MLRLGILAFCALILVGCARKDVVPFVDRTRAAEARSRAVQFEADGRYWPTYVEKPDACKTKPCPAILILHSEGGTGTHLAEYFGLRELAKKENFITIAPTSANGGWIANDKHMRYPTQIDFVKQLMKHLESDAYQQDRIYLAGHGSGGRLALRMLSDYPGRFAGAVVSGTAAAVLSDTWEYHEIQTPSKPTGVMFLHGLDNSNVPYEGSRNLLGARDGAELWAEKLCGKVAPKVTNLTPEVVRED